MDCKKYTPAMYVILRVVVGLMFFVHGLQKFGYFGGPGIANFTGMVFGVSALAYLVGIVETLGGLGIALGFFTRLSSWGGAIIMIVALLTVHLPQGFNLFTNGGERALLYLVAFLYMGAKGNGAGSLEQAVLQKETF